MCGKICINYRRKHTTCELVAVTNGKGAGATSGALYAIGATGAIGRSDGLDSAHAMAMSTTTAI